jgi:hypothetical protein
VTEWDIDIVHVVPVLLKPVLGLVVGACGTTKSFVEELSAGRGENGTALYFK